MADDALQHACLEAEGGAAQAEAALLALAEANPSRPEPLVCLAKLHRRLGLLNEHETVDRRRLLEARRLLLAAIQRESPPSLETLALLRQTTHDLALHAEQTEYFAALAQRDHRPQIRFTALSWASVALECRGHELAAAGKPEQAAACYEQSVARHRQARAAWPDAPLAARLDALFGGSHTVGAYAEAGRHTEWIALMEAELDSCEGRKLPAALRVECLAEASDVAARGKLSTQAVRLVERALAAWSETVSDGVEGRTQLRVRLLGQLLLAHKGQGDAERAEKATCELRSILSELESTEAEPSDDLRYCYNLAARTFVVAEEWELAAETARRAIEVWDFGPNHAFLAAALWAGFRDRTGALEALRNAARDARLSGKGMCRNLRDDFLRSPHFADVRDDPEFLHAVEVPGVLD